MQQTPAYALGKEVCNEFFRDPKRTTVSFPTDIAVNDKQKYYQLLQLVPDSNAVGAHLLQRFSVLQVERILGAKDGELQWRVLN